MLHKAEHLGLLDAAGLAADRPGRRSRAIAGGLAQLRDAGVQLTRSELEERMLALLDARGLPHPRANTYAHGHEVDFLYEADAVGATIAALLSLDSARPRWGSRAVKGDGL